MGFERIGEGWERRGKRGRGGRERSEQRGRDRSRELASPSANFITELVVFAQIISIYSTQAGNLFASECMREWNLPPRSRLARARMRACVVGCTDVWMGTGARMRPLHTAVHTRRDRVNASLALTFSVGKRKVTRTRFHVKSARVFAPAGRLAFARSYEKSG